MKDNPCAAYIEFFETLSPEAVPKLRDLCDQGVVFRDPFNEVTGVGAMIEIFEHMYRVTENPRFVIRAHACQGDTCFIAWVMTFRSKRQGMDAPEIVIDGVSEVVFSADGKVLRHLDHWDAASQLYEKIPIFGALIRGVRRRMSS